MREGEGERERDGYMKRKERGDRVNLLRCYDVSRMSLDADHRELSIIMGMNEFFND